MPDLPTNEKVAFGVTPCEDAERSLSCHVLLYAIDAIGRDTQLVQFPLLTAFQACAGVYWI